MKTNEIYSKCREREGESGLCLFFFHYLTLSNNKKIAVVACFGWSKIFCVWRRIISGLLIQKRECAWRSVYINASVVLSENDSKAYQK